MSDDYKTGSYGPFDFFSHTQNGKSTLVTSFRADGWFDLALTGGLYRSVYDPEPNRTLSEQGRLEFNRYHVPADEMPDVLEVRDGPGADVIFAPVTQVATEEVVVRFSPVEITPEEPENPETDTVFRAVDTVATSLGVSLGARNMFIMNPAITRFSSDSLYSDPTPDDLQQPRTPVRLEDTSAASVLAFPAGESDPFDEDFSYTFERQGDDLLVYGHNGHLLCTVTDQYVPGHGIGSLGVVNTHGVLIAEIPVRDLAPDQIEALLPELETRASLYYNPDQRRASLPGAEVPATLASLSTDTLAEATHIAFSGLEALHTNRHTDGTRFLPEDTARQSLELA